MYWSDAGSYYVQLSAVWRRSPKPNMADWGGINTHVDLNSVSFRKTAHLPFGEKAIGEEGEQDKLG
jgi:hypothetical protein